LRAGGGGPGPRARVTALCDVDPARLKQAFEIAAGGAAAPGPRPRGSTSPRALLDLKDVDAVVIATPVHLHASQAVAALLAGKHVYCEKPLGLDPAECREVLEAARAAEARGLAFQVGLQRRYSPRYRRSIEVIHSGEAGRVLFVRAQWHAAGEPPREKPWLYRRARSGGMAVEQACHQFDVFNWLFQAAPLRACGFEGTARPGDPPGRDTPGHYGAVIEYPGGATVQLSHLTFAMPDRRFHGTYELAFAERMGVDLANAVAWTADGASRQLLSQGPQGAAGRTGEVSSETQRAVEAFLSCAAAGRRPEAGAEVGYRATLAALLCARALETGQAARWSEVEPGGPA
ncbi:MAG: Gfo/Idh/MocA family oxidoreductase, partial [Planctomycetes bacterium]|nr:Gfo/Idh/MocA family oxidoreductase [Planctomycetota bacterium]